MSRWREVRAEVLRRIQTRDWPPGATLPAETVLAAEFGCARATVNRALRDLATSGLLERRRKSGTRVSVEPARRAFLSIPVTRREIEGNGQRYGYVLISDQLRPGPADVCAALGLADGTALRHVVAIHLADGAAFVHEDRWLCADALGRPAPSFADVSANEWLVAHLPYTRGRIVFSARGVDAALAGMFGVAPGTAQVTVHRATFAGDEPVTAVTLVYRPGYTLEAEL